MKKKAYINILKEWNKDELFAQATIFNSKKEAQETDEITDSLEIVDTIEIEINYDRNNLSLLQ